MPIGDRAVTKKELESLARQLRNQIKAVRGHAVSWEGTFLDLNDTPDSFSGEASKVVSVSSDEVALEFGADLNDLEDVNAPSPSDDNILMWDDGAGEWIAGVVPGDFPTQTTGVWNKTIGATGDYADWATMIADMPDLIAHAVTITIQTGTTLTESCNLKNKVGIDDGAEITIQAEESFPQDWSQLPTATSATATTLVDTGQTWDIDRFIDCWVLIVDGTGTDNGYVQITDSDATSITVASWPGTQPDNTSRYLIVGAIIDGEGTRTNGLDFSTNTPNIFVEGIGLYDGDYQNAQVHSCKSVAFKFVGSYTTTTSAITFMYNTDFIVWGCGIVNSNTTDNGASSGLKITSGESGAVYYCGFSDNKNVGILAQNMTSIVTISNCFGDGNGDWGTEILGLTPTIFSGTECSGSLGDHTYQVIEIATGGEVTLSQTLILSDVVNAGVDTDKFLVLDSSGNVDFRTGAEVLSDIGGGGVLDMDDLANTNLADPDADRIVFWDDVPGEYAFLVPTEGVQIETTNLLLDVNGLSEVAPASGDFFVFYDLTDSTHKKVDFDDMPSGGAGGGAENPMAHRRSGRGYTTWDYQTSTTQSATRDKLYAYPFIVPVEQAFDRIVVAVSTAQTGGVARCGIYDDSGCYPDALVLDSGELDCSTTGYKTTTISETLPAGLYWLVLHSDATTLNITFRAMDYNATSPFSYYAILGKDPTNFITLPPTHWSLADTYQALQDPFPAGATAINNENLITIMLRKT